MRQQISDENSLLSERLFAQFKKLIHTSCGISLADSKRTMLSVRLLKRLRTLNMQTFEEYFNYICIETNLKNELQSLLNVVTTNKTDFYRENHHFQFLTDNVVPELRSRQLISDAISLKIWSAGCSSGEEPYTLSIVMAEIMGAQTGNYEILATDISTKVLGEARNAVYSESSVATIPDAQKKKYLLRGTGTRKGQYKIAPEIQKHVTFGRLNFTDEKYHIAKKMHVIFCRNVLIYFDSKTRDEIIQKLCEQLVPYGYLFIGHSETLVPIEYQLERLLPTVYRKIMV